MCIKSCIQFPNKREREGEGEGKGKGREKGGGGRGGGGERDCDLRRGSVFLRAINLCCLYSGSVYESMVSFSLKNLK